MQAKNLLEVSNLTISFEHEGKRRVVVDHLSYVLGRGEVLGVVGESGCGKTVSALSLMQLISSTGAKVEDGKAMFYDENGAEDLLTMNKTAIRRLRGNRIAMIFQDPMTSLNPVHRCGDQVSEVLRLHKGISEKNAKSETLKWFEEVKLGNAARIYKSYPHELSGGQRQRVMIAMAIACCPDLLIADEPTTALDVTVQKAILDLLRQLGKRYGISILFITHDLGVVKQLADHVLVMLGGKGVEYGTVQDVFERPQHAYTKGLLACRPTQATRLIALPTVDDYLAGGTVCMPATEKAEVRMQRLQKIYAQKPFLEVKNLHVCYPVAKNLWGKTTAEATVIENLSLSLYKGETLGIVGESGCGKTTLGRSLLQLLHPAQSGGVFYKGENLSTLSVRAMRRYRKDLQIVFQDPYSALNPRQTVGESILEPMRIHRMGKSEAVRRSIAITLLEKVGISSDFLPRYPHELSGGQRQRICIARAVALSPEVIICDESVSALDVSVQAKVLNLLNSLKQEFGFTCLFISHDLSVVRFMSDRIIVMQKGEIVESQEADQLYQNPQTTYTQQLLSSIPE